MKIQRQLRMPGLLALDHSLLPESGPMMEQTSQDRMIKSL